VFPVRYEVDLNILFRRNSVLYCNKALHHKTASVSPPKIMNLKKKAYWT
jgi:hypothetical protein